MKYNFIKLLSGGGVTNTTNSGLFNRSNVNKSYIDIYKKLFTKGTKMEDLNKFFKTYYDLRKGSGYTGNKAIKYNGVKDYLTSFNDYGFHTTPFMQGWQHTSNALSDSGDNFDSGTWNKADDYYGAITHLRYANSFNADELNAMNEMAKAYNMLWEEDPDATGLDTGDGRKFYRLTALSLNAGDLIDNNPDHSVEENDKDNNEEVANKTVETPPYPKKQEDSKWSDWLPLTALLGNDLLSALRQADWQKRMKFPLMEAPTLMHKITDNYHMRALLQQNANELRNLGVLRSISSDLRANMDNIFKYDTQASEIEKQAALEKANKYAQEAQVSENDANLNLLAGIEAANFNDKSRKESWNNILDANRRRDLARTQALNSYIGNMATSYGQYVLDKKINDLAYLKGLNEYNTNLEQQQIADRYYDFTHDVTKSLAYKNYANWLLNSDEALSLTDIDSERLSDPETRDTYIKELFETHSSAQKYRDAHKEELTNATRKYMDKMRLISNKLYAMNLSLPAKLNNQGPYFSPSYKQGGSVRARYIDYQNHISKESRDAKQAQHKRNALSTKKLEQDLDRLSREQLILLRSIFK